MTTHVCVAPSGLTKALTSIDASTEGLQRALLRLPHPRTGLPALFLPNSDSEGIPGSASGILEVQSISPDCRRSWFTGNNTVIAGPFYVLTAFFLVLFTILLISMLVDGKLLLLTPIDPVFLLIPIFLAIQNTSTSGQFKPLDDIFEDAVSKLTAPPESEVQKPTLPLSQQDILALLPLSCIKPAAERICDFKEITEEIVVYRFSRAKLLELLRTKVSKVADKETFDSFRSLIRGLAKDGLGDTNESATESLRQAGRYRLACNALSQYLPPDIYNELLASYDLSELNAHMQSSKDEETASRTIAPAKQVEDKSAKDANATKGKGNASRGVALLSKADVSGMAKLSKFFAKKEKAK